MVFLAAATLALLGTPVSAASNFTDVDILNFALNLEVSLCRCSIAENEMSTCDGVLRANLTTPDLLLRWYTFVTATLHTLKQVKTCSAAFQQFALIPELSLVDDAFTHFV